MSEWYTENMNVDATDTDADVVIDGTDTVTTETPKTKPRKTKAKRALSRYTAKRYVDQVLAVHEADDDVLRFVCSSLNIRPADDRVLAASILQGVSVPQAIDDVLAVMATEVGERPYLFFAKNREDMRAMWSVLSDLGSVSGSLPTTDMEAAKALVSAFDTLSESATTLLTSALDLLRA